MKKKILILGKIPPPFMGPAIATRILLDSSLKDRYDLIHLDTRANATLQTMGRWSLRKVIKNIGIYFTMFRKLKARPDVVLIPISQSTTGFIKDSIFIFLSRLSGRKTIVQLRGSNFGDWFSASSTATRFFVRNTLKMTQGVIVLGNSLKYIFRPFFRDEQIFVVPNGGNYNLNFTVKQNPRVSILYLANLQASKGIEDIVMAVNILARRMNNFELNVVGEWRSETTKTICEKIVTENNLPVTFHNAATGEEKLKFMSNADIFVFTPRAPEGHPWVIVESMAAGLPVISTDRGAITESVIDGANGFIVPVESPDAIASKLEQLITDRSLRERMGRASRDFYERNFTEDKMVANLSAVFEKLISR